MQKIIEQYKEKLIHIYPKELLKNKDYDYLLVFKEDIAINDPKILVYNYNDDFENELTISLPDKIRKPRKLLTYHECLEIIKRNSISVLTISNDIPYSVPINHFVYNNHIYFHCGKTGYKLKGVNKQACLLVYEDLGINEMASTQNHRSVHVYGTLKEVKENKKELLIALMEILTPNNVKEVPPQAVENVNILEVSLDHVIGKLHFY